MLSREIRESSNLVSYREREATQIPENSNFADKTTNLYRLTKAE